MKLLFKTNNHFIPVYYTANEKKVDDAELDFLITNSTLKKEHYDNSDDRNDAYDNFMNNFVVDNDSDNNSGNSNENDN